MTKATTSAGKWDQRPSEARPCLGLADQPFRLFLERSADPIIVLDPANGTFVDGNAAAVSLVRCGTREVLLSSSLRELSPPFQPDGRSSVTRAAELMEFVCRHGSLRFEWMIRCADGTELPLEVLATSVPIDGRDLHVVVARDVSERKRVDADLRASEQRWRLLFEQSPLSIQVFAPDGLSLQVNAAWERLFCMKRQAVANFNILRDDQLRAQGVHQWVERAFAGQVVYVPPVPYELRENLGEPPRCVKWIGSIMFPLLGVDGRVLEVVCVHEDITERKQAEEVLETRIRERTAELAASEERFRALVEHAPEAIAVLDVESGRFAAGNENTLALFGMTLEQFHTASVQELSPEFQENGERSETVIRRKVQEALEGQAPMFDYTHRRLDGSLVPCEVRLIRLPGEGRPLVRGSIIDTSERRRRDRIQRATYEISEAVHMAEDLESLYLRIHRIIQTLMPANNFYIALYDAVADHHFYAYHVDEVDPRPSPRKMDRGLNGYVWRTGQALLADRASMLDPIHEWSLQGGTPSAIWLGVPLQVAGRPIGIMALQDYRDERAYGNQEKQLLGFVAAQVASAIHRKRAEQALRESEEKFRALYEASSQGVMLHDENQFLEVNPAAVRILGFQSEAEIIGHHPMEFAAPMQPGGGPPEVLAPRYIQQCMTTGAARFDWLCQSPSGVVIPIEVILTRISWGGRQVIQAVINDITERKNAEAELLNALEREKELGRLKSSFVTMVSHEFRTPLGIIMSSAEILQHYLASLSGEERENHLRSIHKNTRRMAELMEEVLLLGWFEAGTVNLDPTRLDFRVLCEGMIDEVISAIAPDRRIILNYRTDRSEVVADERLLRHLFTNLLANALKYSEAPTSIHFTVEQRQGNAVCTVEDYGIGILESDQKWLFQSFHRGRNVGSRPGTGLGLVIVKRCVELHGGSVSLTSAPRRGTTVQVELPIFKTLIP